MIQKDTKKKTTRLEARTTESTYALVQHAAALQGRSISDFVVSAAQEAAEHIIEQHALIDLTQRDQEQFAKALLKPRPVVPALKRAAAAHRDHVGPA